MLTLMENLELETIERGIFPCCSFLSQWIFYHSLRDPFVFNCRASETNNKYESERHAETLFFVWLGKKGVHFPILFVLDKWRKTAIKIPVSLAMDYNANKYA